MTATTARAQPGMRRLPRRSLGSICAHASGRTGLCETPQGRIFRIVTASMRIPLLGDSAQEGQPYS
mgnify:CR=1 FL=1